MADVTGTIGSEPVELNNAATEATLRAMLAALNRQTAAIVNMSKSGGGGGAMGANTQATQASTKATQQQTQATGQQTVATNAATESMSKFAKGAMIFGGIIGDLVGGVAKTATNLAGFAGSLMDGTGNVSDFYGALKDLPLGLGIVAGLFQKIAQMQEAELKTYRDLSKAGVNFGGSLNTVRMNALSLGMTMDEYSKVITNNREALQKLGGDTDTGARAFQNMAMQLRNSELGDQLRSMGNSTEDITNGLGSYIKQTGARGKAEMDNVANQKALAQSAGEYMKNLQLLSQLTGESKEALEAKMAEETQEAQFQQYMSTLSADEQKKAMQIMQESSARFGKAGAQATKDILMGLPPMTEAGQQIMAQSKGFATTAAGYSKMMKDGSLKGEQAQKQISATTDKGVKAMGEEAKAMGITNYAIGRLGGVASEVTAIQAKSNQALIAADGNLTKQREQQLKENEALQNSAAGNAQRAEKGMKDMGAAIYGALQPAIAFLTPVVNDLANQFMGFVKDNMPAIRKQLTVFAEYMADFAKNLMSPAGREKIINDLVYYLKLMWIEVKANLPWPFNASGADTQRSKDALELEKQSFNKKAEAARLEMENQTKLDALKVKQGQGDQANWASQVEAAESTKAALEKTLKENKNLDDVQKKAIRSSIEEAEQTIADKKAAVDMAKDASFNTKAASEVQSQVDKLKEEAAKKEKESLAAKNGQNTSTLQEQAKTANINNKPPVNTTVEKKASGGPVKTDVPYWVGEDGPELFTTKTAGEIIPNDKTKDLNTLNKDSLPMPTPDFKGGMDNMTKNLQGNFKNIANGMPKEQQQNQEIKLSNETLASFRKIFNSDFMPKTQLSENTKDTVQGLDTKNQIAQMSKSIHSTLFDNIAKQSDSKEKSVSPETYQKLLDNISKIQPISDEAMKNMQMQSKAMLDINKDNKEKNKENLVSKENKVPDINSNQSKIQTDMFKSFTDTLLPGFINKLPGIGDLGKKQDETQPDTKSFIDNMTKNLDDKIKSITSNVNNTANIAPGTDTKVVNENLLKEMQQLNKNTVELLKYTKMTLEENKNQTSKLGSLSGNLYV
jgi:hypothetical protein